MTLSPEHFDVDALNMAAEPGSSSAQTTSALLSIFLPLAYAVCYG